QCPAGAVERVALTSLRHPRDDGSDVAFLLAALGQLWLAGVAMDWAEFYRDERRRRVPLPTYPFERQRYWVEPQQQAAQPAAVDKQPDLADWFYLPGWKRSAPHECAELAAASNWLVFLDGCGVGAQLVRRLEQLGQD